ncbi:hypothetical protein FN846DRAFT_919229 [Sphaerosporella brunnea]|uniref:Uncharacterized protein n=1 Tax=Sphaerosporella brunnea TaxID=1250544 RepID=A0A5J5EWV3_9PEZI|nr:hypothetical protein FN846DRAFT_919229 [Sphaerosporella brunnea]
MTPSLPGKKSHPRSATLESEIVGAGHGFNMPRQRDPELLANFKIQGAPPGAKCEKMQCRHCGWQGVRNTARAKVHLRAECQQYRNFLQFAGREGELDNKFRSNHRGLWGAQHHGRG